MTKSRMRFLQHGETGRSYWLEGDGEIPRGYAWCEGVIHLSDWDPHSCAWFYTTSEKAEPVFGFQGLLHMAIALRLAPITGLTLPLVSRGGSSLISTFAGLGLAASVAARSRNVFLGGERDR